MTNKEQWKEYKNTGYFVSDLGRVRGKRNGQLLKFDYNIRGYKRVTLCFEDKVVRVFVHRLVWKTFVGDIAENMVIDHKDERKYNNALTNLQAVTQSYNIKKNWAVRKARVEYANAA